MHSELTTYNSKQQRLNVLIFKEQEKIKKLREEKKLLEQNFQAWLKTYTIENQP